MTWAIINGEKTHEVTLHEMNEKVDQGDIIYRKIIDIRADETGYSLGVKCHYKGLEIVKEFINDIANNKLKQIKRTKQVELNGNFYSRSQNPLDKYWNNFETMNEVERISRGIFLGPNNGKWGYPKVLYEGIEYIILKHNFRKEEVITRDQKNTLEGGNLVYFYKDGIMEAKVERTGNGSERMA